MTATSTSAPATAPGPAPLFDAAAAARHCKLIGLTAKAALLRSIHWKGGDARKLHPGRHRLREIERLQAEGHRIYLIAGGADTDPEVESIPAVFAEWDGLSHEEVDGWLAELAATGFPDQTLRLETHLTGSIHIWLRLEQPTTDIPRWRQLMERLVVVLGSDATCTNPSQLMRLAGSSYIAKPGHPRQGQVIGQARILEEIEDATTTLEELEEWVAERFAANPQLLELLKANTAARQRDGNGFEPATEAERTERKGRALPPRSMAQIKQHLAEIPRRVSGLPSGDPLAYPFHRFVVAGLRDALYRLCGDKQQAFNQAIELMEAHSPSKECGWNIAQVLASSLWLDEGCFWARGPQGRKPNGAGMPSGDRQPRPAPAGEASIEQQLTAAISAITAHQEAAPSAAEILDHLDATNAELAWPDRELMPVLDSLAGMIAARICADGTEANLLHLRDAVVNRWPKLPASHLNKLIKAKRAEWEAEHRRLKGVATALRDQIEAPQRQEAQEAEAQRVQAEAQQATGINAVVAALGDGWDTDANTGERKHTNLSIGQMCIALAEVLGDRLGFDELNLMPAIDELPLDPAAIELLYVKLSANGWTVGKDGAIDALMEACRRRTFHPVEQYLGRIADDPSIEPINLETFGADYFGITDPLQQRFLQIMVLGPVARIFEPGKPFKTCVVLHSREQTFFKSEALRRLAGPEWFCDSHQEQDKDLKLAIHSCWIYELAELDAMTGKKDAAALKALLSSPVDALRPPYGRALAKFPRRSTFIGTVNEPSFLVDATGNHRFLVVQIDAPIEFEKIERDRDRIWKAAVLAYRAGALPYLERHEIEASEQRNKGFTQEDPWALPIQEWIQGGIYKEVPDGTGGTQRVCIKAEAVFSSTDVLRDAIGLPTERANSAQGRRLTPILRDLGYAQDANPTRRGELRTRWWRRIEYPEARL